jgi:hypothetical protein
MMPMPHQISPSMCECMQASYKRRRSRLLSSASFLEPIGHSTYGGLWSELLKNGSFEEGLWSAGAIARIKERPELERASKLDLPLP